MLCLNLFFGGEWFCDEVNTKIAVEKRTDICGLLSDA